MSQRAFYLISYDIPDNKHRLKIAHLLEGYGERVQYSVFEVWVTEKQLETVRKQLEKHVEAGKGSVRIYQLCKECQERREVIGDGHPTDAPGLQII